MTVPHQSEEIKEVFIRLFGQSMDKVKRITQVIESLNGRISHAYPPDVLVAVVPQQAIAQLAGNADIESVDNGPIGDERLQQAPSDIRIAMQSWNDHLKNNQHTAMPTGPSAAIPWDTPGLLPPDPPASVREQFRQREREMEQGG